MTTSQLNVALHRELSYIVTDGTMMEQALQSLRKIRREHKAQQNLAGDSARQVKQSLRRAFRELKQVKEGMAVARPVEELLHGLHD